MLNLQGLNNILTYGVNLAFYKYTKNQVTKILSPAAYRQANHRQHRNPRPRSLSPLKSVQDAYPKFLLARTHHDEYDIMGIRVIDIAHWLLEN